MHAIDYRFLYTVIHDIVFILGIFIILVSKLKTNKNNNAFSKKYSKIFIILGILFIIGFGARLIFTLMNWDLAT